MTECDAFNLIDEFIKQSYCLSNDNIKDSTKITNSSLALVLRSSCSGMFSKSSKSENETGVFNTCSNNSNRTSGSDDSYESAMCNNEFKSVDASPGSLKVYNDELINEIDRKNNITPLDQIFVNLNISKNFYEMDNLLTPPGSEKYFGEQKNIEIEKTIENNGLNEGQEIDPPPSEVFNDYFPQKPKRPYSYYAATNIYPLDLTTLIDTQAIIKENSNESLLKEEPKIVKKRTRKNIHVNKPEIANKRLSTSLGDLQINVNIKSTKSRDNSKNRKNKSSSQNQLDYEDQKDKIEIKKDFGKPHRSRSSSRLNKFIRNIFKIDSKSNEFENEEIIMENQTMKISEKKNQDNDLDESANSSSHNFTFTRLFNSFRGSHNSINSQSRKKPKNKRNRNTSSTNSANTICTEGSMKTVQTGGTNSSTISTASQELKKELIVMDEQPSKIHFPKIDISSNNEQASEVSGKNGRIGDKTADIFSSKTSTGYGSANSTSPISSNYNETMSELELMRLKFYCEIACRLRQIRVTKAELEAHSINVLNKKEQDSAVSVSFNLDNVPYIDDDLDSNVDLSEINRMPIIHKADDQKKTDQEQLFDDDVLKKFSKHVCSEVLDGIVKRYLDSFSISEWKKISIIFVLALETIKFIDLNKTPTQGDQSLLKQNVKKTVADYIHYKYCDWIFENGGWNSVPSSNSITIMQCVHSERIH